MFALLAMLALLAASPVLALSAAVVPPTRVVMKFGGSSVRDAERISEVCKIVKDQIDSGVEPHLVCSAMGKTTNNLLAAADHALSAHEVDLSAVRALHSEAAASLGISETDAFADVCSLIDECERTLEGVSMLGELSPRTRDRAGRPRCASCTRASCSTRAPAPAPSTPSASPPISKTSSSRSVGGLEQKRQQRGCRILPSF